MFTWLVESTFVVLGGFFSKGLLGTLSNVTCDPTQCTNILVSVGMLFLRSNQMYTFLLLPNINVGIIPFCIAKERAVLLMTLCVIKAVLHKAKHIIKEKALNRIVKRSL